MRAHDLGIRRIALTVVFVLWLGTQPLAIASSPAWGMVLPHEHISRGALTERAWREHLREHRLWVGNLPGWNCSGSHTTVNAHVVASVPSLLGALSLLPLVAADVQDSEIEIPAFSALRATWALGYLYAFEISYSPLEPPPNL